MISAFGVDHGEQVSKLGLAGVGSLVSRVGRGVSGATGHLGAMSARGGARTLSVRGAGQAANPMRQRVGLGQVRAGGGLQSLSGRMMGRQGLTGGVTLGAGAAGVGGVGVGAAHHFGSNKPRQF